MKKTIYIICFITAITFISCKQEQSSDDLLQPFYKISKSASYSDVKHLYTNGTIAIVDRAVDQDLLSKSERKQIVLLLNKDIKWEEFSRNISGEEALIKLKFTDHPVENLIGFIVQYRLIQEDGSWKIDMERELEKVIDARRGKSPVKYIENIK